MIFIGVLAFNSADYIDDMLASIRTSYPHIVYILDNGSEDGTQNKARWWAEDDNIVAEFNTENVGVAAGWNQIFQTAIQNFDALDMIMVCNDDIILHPDCIDNLHESLERYLYDGISAGRVVGKYERFLEFDHTSIKPRWVPGMYFSCYALRPYVYERVGPFDENFGLCYVEDTDYYYQMEQLRFNIGCDRHALFYHHRLQPRGSVTIEMRKAQHRKNRGYFKQKWGFPPREVARRMMAGTRV